MREKRTRWDGVRNNLALKHLRQVRKGDQIFYYHTGKEKAVVGTMTALSDPFPDPEAGDERYVVVDVAPVSRLHRPVSLAEIKANPMLGELPLVRLPRLSIMPVTQAEWREVERLAGA